MNFDTFFAFICSYFDLGSLVKVFPMQKGLLHRVYPVETSKNKFAIKLLNQHLTQDLQYLHQIKIAQEFARACLAQGIPAVTARIAHGDVIFLYENQNIMVFPWIEEGESAEEDHVLPLHLLKKIHQVGSNFQYFGAQNLIKITHRTINDDWLYLLTKGLKQKYHWSSVVQQQLPMIEKVIRNFNQVYSELSKNLVFSHGDFLPKNILWDQNDQPFIIDWEFAGLVNLDCEMFDVTFNWNITDGGIKKTLLASKGSLGNWLGWVVFNMKRTFWKDIGLVERNIAELEIVKTLECIRSIVE